MSLCRRLHRLMHSRLWALNQGQKTLPGRGTVALYGHRVACDQRWESLQIDVAATNRDHDRPGAVVSIELRKDALDVVLDCVFGDLEI